MVTEQPAIGRNEGGKKPEVTNKVSALGDLENGVATIPERQFGGRALRVGRAWRKQTGGLFSL